MQHTADPISRSYPAERHAIGDRRRVINLDARVSDYALDSRNSRADPAFIHFMSINHYASL
jgi:hypothetical protein